jgi:hypothetical protein
MIRAANLVDPDLLLVLQRALTFTVSPQLTVAKHGFDGKRGAVRMDGNELAAGHVAG